MSESKAHNPEGTNASQSSARTSQRTWLVVGALFIGGGLLFCGVIAAVVGTSLIASVTERDDVQRELDQFMRAMSRQNSRSAYAMFSTRSQRLTPLARVEQLTRPPNFILFEGYLSLEVQNVSISRGFNTNRDVPQGSVARGRGRIRYAGGYEGQFQAVLEQEGGSWRLHEIHIVVPPEKAGMP